MFRLALLLILLQGNLKLYASESTKNCDSIIQDLNMDETDHLWSYVSMLIDEQLVTTENLQLFYQHLLKGELINPVEHKETPYGVVFKTSTERSFYYRFEQLRSETINYSKMQSLTLDLLKRRGVSEAERSILNHKTSGSVKFDALIDLLTDDPGFLYLMQATDWEPIAKMAPKSTSTLAKQIIKFGGVEKIKFGYHLLSLTSDHFAINYIKELAAEKDSESFLHFFLKDDQTEEYKNLIFELLRNKKSFYQRIEIIKKINKIDPSFLVQIKELVNYSYSDVRDLSYLLNLLLQIKDPETISFLRELVKSEIFEYQPEKRNEIVKAIFKAGDGEFILKHKISRENKIGFIPAYNSLDKETTPYILKLIQLGLQHPNEEVRKAAALALRGRNDSESLKITKRLFALAPTEEQIKLKLQILQGIETDWALAYILEHRIDKSTKTINDSALEALKGGSSLKTKDLIEDWYNQNYEPNYKEQYYRGIVARNLEGRPDSDLLYFLQKYINSKKSDLALKALTLLKGRSYPESKKIAEELALNSLNFYLQLDGIAYMRSLPAQENLNFWYKVSENSNFKKESLRKLLGSTDDKSREFIELAIQDSDKEKGQSALLSYITYFFDANEKTLSENTEDVLKGEELLNVLHFKFIERFKLK